MTRNGRPFRAGLAVRLALILTLTAGAVVVASGPAAAKGAVRARVIAGPGIDAPIKVRDFETIHELAQVTGVYAITYGGNDTSVIDKPAGELGPRYVVEVTVALSGGDLPIRQDVYPYAGGGPVVHTAGGQLLEQLDPKGKRPCSVCKKTTDTWQSASPDLYGVIHDLALPAPRTTLAAVRAAKVDPGSWVAVAGADRRISVKVPASWNVSPSTMLPVQVDPVMPLAVGTATVEPQPVGECGIVPQRALQAVGPTDAFVGIYVTAGLASWDATTAERPKTFAAALPWSMTAMKCTTDVTALLHSISFEDNGVKLTLLVAMGPQISDERRAELVAVLDSLSVSER